jgi:hypothetical protein
MGLLLSGSGLITLRCKIKIYSLPEKDPRNGSADHPDLSIFILTFVSDARLSAGRGYVQHKAFDF